MYLNWFIRSGKERHKNLAARVCRITIPFERGKGRVIMGLKKINHKLLVLMLVLIPVFIIASGCFAQTGTRENWTTVEEAVNAITAQMTAAVGPSAGAYEKALWLHDWLTDNAYYALDAYGNPSNANVHHSAEGVLLQGTGVCESYARAYQLLLNKAGIANEYVTGRAINPDGGMESHAWNLVNFDGEWAYVDVTWDDPIHGANPFARRETLFSQPDS